MITFKKEYDKLYYTHYTPHAKIGLNGSRGRYIDR